MTWLAVWLTVDDAPATVDCAAEGTGTCACPLPGGVVGTRGAPELGSELRGDGSFGDDGAPVGAEPPTVGTETLPPLVAPPAAATDGAAAGASDPTAVCVVPFAEAEPALDWGGEVLIRGGEPAAVGLDFGPGTPLPRPAAGAPARARPFVPGAVGADALERAGRLDAVVTLRTPWTRPLPEWLPMPAPAVAVASAIAAAAAAARPNAVAGPLGSASRATL